MTSLLLKRLVLWWSLVHLLGCRFGRLLRLTRQFRAALWETL